ncbi:MAG: serine/threonine protein kinase [Clostridiaceae bacterium]|nr:serine/threonine-protein kinase [Desulfitobacteriaceae bacterium]NLB78417.1 serine/threonine protein kinase [Clostridiaceae bacterium]
MLITVGSVLRDEEENTYILDKMIGSGGFANVFKAHRESDGQLFAVKTLLPSFDSAEGLLSFQKELQQAETVESPHVIRYQYTHDGTKYTEYPPYIIMEYADSGALSDLIEKQQKEGKLFEIESLMQLFTQLVSGMDIINKVLVHRDIKPENILICGDTLKISDFGLSKFSGENTRTLTFKGYGTAKYVAPEAWDNDKNTIQMDIYSMGIVFYELATLQYPYDTGGKQDIMAYRNAHLYQPAKNPASINSQLPPNIASVIIRMLEKPTQKRFTNWADILKSLQAEPMPKDNIHSFVDTALKTRNAADIRLQEKLTEEKRLAQLKEDFCRLIYSQYDSTVIEPIRDFISRFNSQYAGTGSYKLTPERGNSSSERFSSTITTPSSNRIQIEMEAILKENHIRKVHVDRVFRDEGYRNENYIPQCNNRDILAWGRVYDSKEIGFNLLLLKNANALYGDWFTLTNTNSGFGRSTRPEPFGFKLDELPREIELIRAVHIYNSDLKPFAIENVLGFVSGCA